MSLDLNFDFIFSDLYRRDGLSRVDDRFCAWLRESDVALYNRLLTARANGCANDLDESDLIIGLAPHLEQFIGQLFGIAPAIDEFRAAHSQLSPIYECKRQFVQRRAAKKFTADQAAQIDGGAIRAQLTEKMGGNFSALLFAQTILAWLQNEEAHASDLALADQYAAWALYHPMGQQYHKSDVLFRVPKKIDPQNLIPLQHEMRDGYRILKLPKSEYRARDGFSLTDAGGNLEFALDHANYCIWCHKQGKDSCSTGLRDKVTKKFQTSPHGTQLAGCPLDEKISEMNVLKSGGFAVGALAAVMIDNPLCAMTGHRICNDCMKSCIYQKQEPVDIPQIETRVLRDVLQLDWGFEIYSLLSRWNPLNFERPLPKPPSGRNILVVGAGPAGINLSHHLIQDGHHVCLIDGLKIEPNAVPFTPIKCAADLWMDTAKRVMAGFGGVAEYGITVRWDKNFLGVVRQLLQRREQFDLYGGVRFGGTITADQAFASGFDHIALCMGAGKPTILDIPGNLAAGVRAASDFLMGLQLTGAAKTESIANLQIRLPAIVVGGGLTAIDTATELLAYYPLQVEKMLQRYELLGDAMLAKLSPNEQALADEFFAHARAIRAERQKPNPDVIGLLQSWGGATICYRKGLTDSPSYTLNHEEVHKAMEEGIYFAPNLTPREIKADDAGHVRAMIFSNSDGQIVEIAANCVLVAAGTQPNTVLARESPDMGIALDGKYFAAYDADGHLVKPEKSAKPNDTYIFMHSRTDGRKISFFGDLHPSFAGNVVKAMASAKRGYPIITAHLAQLPIIAGADGRRDALRRDLTATVHAVNRLTGNIVEVVVHAPMAARNFRPGQFYRLQNFESSGQLTMEGLALTGAWADAERGLLSTIILEMGGSSNLCQFLKPGEPIVLMGPTGTPTEIPNNERVVLVGGGLGNAVLFSIGKAMRANGCHVTYFAGYKNPGDVFKPDDIESASDVVVWCCDSAPAPTARRTNDRQFVGNIVNAMAHNSDLLAGADRLIVIGSDRMMAAVAHARHHQLKSYLPDAHIAIGSINSPMQCMMKEICAQCVQRHIDPVTGQEEIVFSCFNQDQELDRVDWECLRDRLGQNSLQEKTTAAWIAHVAKTG